MRKPLFINPLKISKIQNLLDHECKIETSGDYLQHSELQFNKWRLIHKIIHDHPFTTNPKLPRADQWRAALDIFRDIGEIELIDWIILQAEVATNLANGIQDMRPRKGGPCHPLLLEYTGNRKRHALAVLHFAREGEENGLYTIDSSWHAKTRNILKPPASHTERTCGGHEGVPWDVPE